MKIHGYILILLLISKNMLFGQDSDYGLKFRSYTVLGKERTSLMLEDGKHIPVKDELKLTFDLQIRKETVFGTVVRFVSNSGELMSLTYASNDKDDRYPVFVVNDEITPLDKQVVMEKWFPVEITLSRSKGTVTIKYGDITKTIAHNLKYWEETLICFGKSTIPSYQNMEVPPVNIKEIKVYDRANISRHWKLKKHNDDICYDEIAQVPAISSNPQWLIDNYTAWNKVWSYNMDFSRNPQYAYNAESNKLYILSDKKTLICYDLNTREPHSVDILGGNPASVLTNQMIYDPIRKSLVSYDLEKQTTSTFSFTSQRWSGNKISDKETHYWHHTTAYCMSDSSIVTFGGYGFYQYNNDIFRFSPNKKWSKEAIISISPRYTAVSIVIGDTLYVFGGNGNKSGKQELATHPYYDFYAINLQTTDVRQLWETSHPNTFIPCGNMVYDEAEKCFYVMTAYKGGTLIKLSKDTPGITVIGSGIGLFIDSDYNFFTLMKPIHEQKLYALFCRNYNKGNSVIDVYSINYPPLPVESIKQIHEDRAPHLKEIILSIIAVTVTAGGILLFIRKRKKTLLKGTGNQTHVENEPDYFGFEEQTPSVQYFNRSQKAMSLLGLFNVKDRDGQDITSQFTPILKKLFLIVALNSTDNKPGINSKVLDSLIWGDKEEKAARNNRNVSINRLNSILENIGDINIRTVNGFWKMIVRDDSFCDYYTAIQLLKQSKTDPVCDEQSTAKLMEVLQFGTLLPYTDEEWLDAFKAEYTDIAIDVILKLIKLNESNKNAYLKVKLVDLIFIFDSLNDDALKQKCNILYHSGKKGLAKFTYDNFSKEYYTLIGEKYPVSFADLIVTK